MHEQANQLAHDLAAQKEALIRAAITHKIGDEWTTADVTGRGEFKILPDKTEIFAFDGVDLIHFYHTRTEVDNSKAGLFMRAVTDCGLRSITSTATNCYATQTLWSDKCNIRKR